MIENVEVITGGASAVYGSDAIAGVINFKLRQKFNGAEISYQPGATTHGDGGNDLTSVIKQHRQDLEGLFLKPN